jgi:pimeloyl-ACP methyl ester carboxylesterase
MKKAIKLIIAIIVIFSVWQCQLHAQDTLYADAGGFKMHMVKKGNGTGPTVIMENGLGMQLEWWFGLDDSLARYANVVTYDRAFLGKSGKGNTDRSGEVVAAELKRALQNTDIKPPYILLGFSLGGYYVKAFARANPDDTKGLLLIDPMPPDAFFREYKTNFPEIYQWEKEMMEPVENAPSFDELVFITRDARKEDNIPSQIPTMLIIAAMAPEDIPENNIPDFPDFDKQNKESQVLLIRHQLQWATHYPLVKTIEVPDASHYIHRYRMDVVLEAFNELMQTIKN